MFHENWDFHSLFLQIFFLTKIINSTTKKRGRKEEKRGRKERKEVRRKKRERGRKEGRDRGRQTILEQKTKDKEKLLKEARGLIILPREEQR